MSDSDDLEAARFRPNLRPILLALVVNLAFGGVFLGWPYVRGRQRTEESARAFAPFAACLFDTGLAEQPGITLPRGERARFATLVVRGEDGWPERCRDELARIAPEASPFLFPSVKTTEARVRQEVGRLDAALARMGRGSTRGVVPEAPLLALAQLQAALADQIRTVGVGVDPARDAIVLEGERDLPTPSIIPTQVAADRWELALDGRALIATSTDDRRVGHTRVVDGRVDTRLARRPRLASLIDAREPPWIAWSTPQAQCEDGCAQRATGLARFVEDRQRLAPIAWLRAHPAGEPSSAVHVVGDRAWVAAITETGIALRRFAIPSEETDEPVTAELDRALEVGEVETVRWIDGDPPVLAWAGADAAGTLAASEGAEPIALERPRGRAYLASAGKGDAGWIVIATERGVRARRAAGGEPLTVPITPRPPARGAVHALCSGACDALEVLVLRDRALSLVTCTAEACGEPIRLDERVATYDAVSSAGRLVVATSSGVASAVRVTRVDTDGSRATSIPGACWEPEQGLGGEPRLAADAERVVVVTRHGPDLRVLESPDAEHWRALTGLEQP